MEKVTIYELLKEKGDSMTSAGEYYHVLNRGNQKQPIFYEAENYLFFLRRLKDYLTTYDAALIAYCLMPNHFHLLMHETKEGSISRCMHALQTSYAKAINSRYQRSGHLFQDTYQKILIQDDNYLLHLSRYIHLNPVKAGLTVLPEDWVYSSYRDYVGLGKGYLPKVDIILSQFPDTEAYREFVMDVANDMDLGGLTLE